MATVKYLRLQSSIWTAVWERLRQAFGEDAKKWQYVGSSPAKEGVTHTFRHIKGGEWSTTTLTVINDTDYTSTQRS